MMFDEMMFDDALMPLLISQRISSRCGWVDRRNTRAKGDEDGVGCLIVGDELIDLIELIELIR